jgi:hypothetical protein
MQWDVKLRVKTLRPQSVKDIVLLVTIWLLSARIDLKSIHRFGTEKFLSFGTGLDIFHWFQLFKCI